HNAVPVRLERRHGVYKAVLVLRPSAGSSFIAVPSCGKIVPTDVPGYDVRCKNRQLEYEVLANGSHEVVARPSWDPEVQKLNRRVCVLRNKARVHGHVALSRNGESAKGEGIPERRIASLIRRGHGKWKRTQKQKSRDKAGENPISKRIHAWVSL